MRLNLSGGSGYLLLHVRYSLYAGSAGFYWIGKIELLLIRFFLFIEFLTAYPEVVADRAADIFLALFTPIPFCLACPVYLACFTAVNFISSHKLLLKRFKIQYIIEIVNI